jgi:hypothetical protein
MGETAMKKCGWCREEITDDKYFTLWIGTKLLGIFCKKCYFEDKKLGEHIRKIAA